MGTISAFHPFALSNKMKDAIMRHPVRVTVTAAAAIFSTTWIATHHFPYKSSSPYFSVAILSIHALAICTLIGVNYPWKHIPISLIAAPLLHLLGIQIKNQTNCSLFPIQQLEVSGYGILGKIEHEHGNGTCLPILTLYTKDAFHRGYAQGYLLASLIQEVFTQIFHPLLTLTQFKAGDFSGALLEKQLAQLYFPSHYKLEIQGIIEGMKKWGVLHDKRIDLTEQDLLLLHAFLDIYKEPSQPRLFSHSLFSACDLTGGPVIAYQSKQGMLIGRNIDCTLNNLSQYLFILRHDRTDQNDQIEMMTFPGYIGAFTAVRVHNGIKRLMVMVNHCGTLSKPEKSIPSHLFARHLIENAKDIKAAKEMVESWTNVASSHHLIIANDQEVLDVQFYPSTNELYQIRTLAEQPHWLITTNHFIDKEGKPMDHASSHSIQRFQVLEKTLTKYGDCPDSYKILQESLKAVHTSKTLISTIYNLPTKD